MSRLNVRYGSFVSDARPPTGIMTFPEKDEQSRPVLYDHKGEPLYKAKPKFGYRTSDDQ
jgi:hypothetical protein